MTISSLSSNISTQALRHTSRPPASNNLSGGQGQNSARDVAAVSQIAAPTINTSGQPIGTTISVTA